VRRSAATPPPIHSTALPGRKIHTPEEEAGCLDVTKKSYSQVVWKKAVYSRNGVHRFLRHDY